MLDLKRPLTIIDLEATGTDPEEDHIIQVATKRLEPGTEGIDGPIGCDPFVKLVNPPCDISRHILDLTGLDKRQIRDALPFGEVKNHLYRFIQDADLAGYNIHSYDWPLLKAEYERIGEDVPGPEDRRIVDAYQLEQQIRPRTLSAVYERRLGDELTNAHDAEADVRATEAILLDQCNEQFGDEEDAPPTASTLENFQRGDYLDPGRKLRERPDGSVEVCFGKHAGKTLIELKDADHDYLTWMYEEIDELRPYLDDVLDAWGVAASA